MLLQVCTPHTCEMPSFSKRVKATFHRFYKVADLSFKAPEIDIMADNSKQYVSVSGNGASKGLRNRIHNITKKLSCSSRKEKDQNGIVELRRHISLLSAVSIAIGSIIGSGIFVSPKGVLQYSGSAPVCLIVWAVCGLVSLCGALCYAELATLIPLSGGDYIYLLRGFENVGRLGPTPAFLFLWTLVAASLPATQATCCIVVAEYIVSLFPSACDDEWVTKVIAVLALTSAAFINCVSVKVTTYLNNVFTATKMIALAVIIFGGIIAAVQNGSSVSSLLSFEGSTASISSLALAGYYGTWSYIGWNSLTYITEEIVNPEKNILRTNLIAIPIIATAYILTNIAYLLVLNTEAFLASDTVAQSFADVALGPVAPVVPILVAASAYGSAIAFGLCFSRTSFVAAREGHLMRIFSYVHINNMTPVPAVALNTLLGIVYLHMGTIDTLITFVTFLDWTFHAFVVIALIYLRITRRNDPRLFQAPWICIVITLASAIFLQVAPIVQKPQWEYLLAILFVLSGLLFYIPFVHFKLHFSFFDKVTWCLQLLFLCAPTEEADEVLCTKL